MLQIIGFMIGGYILLRCIDILCRAPDQFDSSGSRNFMRVCAVLTWLWTAGLMVFLLFSTGPKLAP
jgi:hypothetical protein